jgi:NAD dependent epimerase/dehydratase family enzyme
VGRRLVRRLHARKDLVTVLSRNPMGSRAALPEGVRLAGYTPNKEGPWFDELAHTDAVVSLAGEQIVGVRWSDAKKKEFEASRIGTNEMLVNAIERIPEKHRPKVLVGASGIGYYGPRGADEEVDETSPAGRDYIALLAQRWEEALARASALGLGSCTFRGDPGQGRRSARRWPALSACTWVPLGSGQQIMPVGHIDDG